jgi:hypothetical protein
MINGFWIAFKAAIFAGAEEEELIEEKHLGYWGHSVFSLFRYC